MLVGVGEGGESVGLGPCGRGRAGVADEVVGMRVVPDVPCRGSSVVAVGSAVVVRRVVTRFWPVGSCAVGCSG